MGKWFYLVCVVSTYCLLVGVMVGTIGGGDWVAISAAMFLAFGFAWSLFKAEADRYFEA